jgi:arabinan endo-1,5-alpha-L-arabinosidase
MLEGGGTILKTGDDRWKGPGGQDVYQNGEGWLLTYHSYDAQNNGRPALRIEDLYWDADQWPTLAKPGK